MINVLKHKTYWRTVLAFGFSILCGQLLLAQTTNNLNIDSCNALAKKNYPLVKQLALIEKTKEYTISNVSKGYLPQISFNGQATYQSAVTALPISLPGVSVPTLSKDQYKIYGEINQSLTDGITIKHQKELVEANTAAEQQKLEVELYKLTERINQLYFGILLIDEQLKQTELLKKDITNGINKTNAAITNGIAIKTSVVFLKAELLKADQRTIELQANRKAFTDILALFINQPVDENTVLQTPVAQTVSATINRPELKMYDLQKRSFDIQNKLINTKNIPRVGLFFQGGYGRPTLNFLNNEFSTYYIGGLRVSWNLSNLYTLKKDKELTGINKYSIDVQKETFLFNTKLNLAQQDNEITKCLNLIATDNQIIALREQVKATTSSQLENGTATTNDYLTHVNAEDQARLNLALHQMQLLMAQYNHKTISGN